jgi:hypothetical protein
MACMNSLMPMAFAAFLALATGASAQTFQLPVECGGGACFIQNYVDYDGGSGARDVACGHLTYDGHDGLDFRAPASRARAGVSVVAPAAGVVRGARDGEPDGAFMRSGASAVVNRQCGNGVLIDHGGGWESQICHLRSGSVRVRNGQTVTAGQVVGLLGMSGEAAFPHVHLRMRRNGAVIDPWTGAPLAQASCAANPPAPGAHWTAAARAALNYRGTELFASGFTGAAPQQDARVEDLPENASRGAPALVFWAVAVGPRTGDILRVRLIGPDGAVIAEGDRVQPRDQAQSSVFAGKRTPPQGWPAGAYRGEARLLRNGAVVEERNERLVLR